MEATDQLNLIICGGMRCGTTSLKHYLAEHPDIAFIGEKDVVINDEYIGYPFASPSIMEASYGENGEIYRQISFRLAGKVKYIGTKWPYFMLYPHIPFNLREHLPDARLIFILRNPVDMVYSGYQRLCEKKKSPPKPFMEAIQQVLDMIKQHADLKKHRLWYDLFSISKELPLLLERGFYYHQLIRFYHCFPKKQILVLRFDQLVDNPKIIIDRVTEFLELGISFTSTRIGTVMNAGPKHSPMPLEARQYLQQFYNMSNAKLLKFLDWPLTLWDENS